LPTVNLVSSVDIGHLPEISSAWAGLSPASQLPQMLHRLHDLRQGSDPCGSSACRRVGAWATHQLAFSAKSQVQWASALGLLRIQAKLAAFPAHASRSSSKSTLAIWAAVAWLDARPSPHIVRNPWLGSRCLPRKERGGVDQGLFSA